jgi:hypothetical protein
MSYAVATPMVLLLVLAAACVGQGKDMGVKGRNGIEKLGGEAGQWRGTERGSYAPGEILVKFREGTDEGTMARIQQEAHLETIRVVSTPNLYLMKIVDGTPVEEMVERLRRYGEVAYAEPNYVRRIQ